MIEEDIELLPRAEDGRPPAAERMSNGGWLISVFGVKLPPGWSRTEADVLFVAPPGFPAAQPDCFWVSPSGFRLADGATPHASNDSNPIPGDAAGGRSTTWFSWHLQGWNPNEDGIVRYFSVIMNRLRDVR